MEETIKDNSALTRTKILDALKYLLSHSEYWWKLSVTVILLINTTILMTLFVSFLQEQGIAYVEDLSVYFLMFKASVVLLIVSFVGHALYKIFYGYSGNKYKKLGGEET